MQPVSTAPSNLYHRQSDPKRIVQNTVPPGDLFGYCTVTSESESESDRGMKSLAKGEDTKRCSLAEVATIVQAITPSILTQS